MYKENTMAAVEFGTPLLPDRIQGWARSAPERLALVFGARARSHADLDRDVETLAAALHRRQVGRGDLVALALPRSDDLYIGILAVWRLGAAYVPVDTGWPRDRVTQILDICRPKALLASRQAQGQEGACGAIDVLHVEDVRQDGVAGAAPTRAPARPEQLAYVVFTSGSTGTPKGVRISHGSLHNYVAGAAQALELERRQHYAVVSSVAADLGYTTLFGGAYVGATLHIAAEQEVQDGPSFSRFLASHAIDCLKIVPSHLDALLEGNGDAVLRGLLVLGGEAAQPGLLRKLRAQPAGLEVVNHYGPAETTVGVAIHRFDELNSADPDALADMVQLSQILPNNRVYVLDEQLRHVDDGVEGELHIGGAQLFDGYVGDDDRRKVVDDPYAPGELLYATGDRAVRRQGGAIVLRGRKDDQVKLRGFRVELAEVEAAACRTPGVGLACAKVAQAGGVDRLLLYFVNGGMEGGSPVRVEPAAVREALAAMLPNYMVPDQVIALDAFPRLPNGKIDRRMLPVDLPTPVTASPAGESPVDLLLARLAGDLLKRDNVQAGDDFFAIGGHSLLVIRLVARIRERLEVRIPPSVVFRNPVFTQLADYIRGQAPDPAGLELAAAAAMAAEPS